MALYILQGWEDFYHPGSVWAPFFAPNSSYDPFALRCIETCPLPGIEDSGFASPAL